MTTDKCELLVIQDYQKIMAENNQTVQFKKCS